MNAEYKQISIGKELHSLAIENEPNDLKFSWKYGIGAIQMHRRN